MIENFEVFLIVTQVIVAWICWHLFWEWLVYELGKDKYEALLIASVFQAIVTVCCYVLDAKEIGVGKEEVLPNTGMEKAHMIVASGFFMHDTPHWEPSLSLTNITLFCHHLLSLAIFLMVLLHGSCGSFVLEMSTLLELTTPLLLVRYYQKEAGYSSKATEISYVILFTFLRFWYGANLTLIVLENEDVPPILQVMTFLIFVTSMFLFPGVTKMALARTPSSSPPAIRGEEPRNRTSRRPRSRSRPRRSNSNSRRGRRRRSTSRISLC